MKYTLHAQQAPAVPHELDAACILTNDVSLPWERHYHNMRLWVIGNEFGALCAVWASCEQDALDEAADTDLLAGLSAEDEDDECECIQRLGNHSDPYNMSYAWISKVILDEIRDVRLLCLMAEARGMCAGNLSEI